MNILISGAGISGLTLAYWLKQYGFNPTLVEKHPALRTGGYKVDIRGNALDVIRRMGIYEIIYAHRTDMNGATIIDAAGNAKEMEADLCGGRIEGDLEIYRGDLCEVIFQQIVDLEILFDNQIVSLTENANSVDVSFQKGGIRTFDLVLGADGLHSKVRKLLFGPEENCIKELGLYISVSSIPNFLNLDRWEIEYFDSQKFINVYSAAKDKNAKLGFAFPSVSQFPKNRAEQQQLLQTTFENVGWKCPELLAAIKDAPDFYFDLVAQVNLAHWSIGRIALAGDAAYAPSPISGQGTSVALIGSYILASTLAEARGDYKKAFLTYEKTLRPFIKQNQELVELSLAFMTNERNSSLAWLHDELLNLLQPNIVIDLFKRWGVKRIAEAATSPSLKYYLETHF